MLKKRCVYLDLVFNRLLGWEGGSSCVVLGDSVHTGPSSAPQQGILIGYNNSHKKVNLFLINAKSRKWVQIFVGGNSDSRPLSILLITKSYKSCKSRFRPFHPSLLFFHPSHLPNLPISCPSHPGMPQPPVRATPDRIPPQEYHRSPPSPSRLSDTPR